MVFEKVKEIIVDTLNCEQDKVVMGADLKEDIGADSLDAVELNIALEESFSITIPDEDLAGFQTVADIVTYIQNKSDSTNE